MGDIAEGATVDDRRVVLHRLDEIRHQGVAEKHGHGSCGLERRRRHRRLVEGATDDDVAEPTSEIGKAGREAEDSHDLGGNRDVETRLPREAIGDATERGDDVAERPIIHVHDPPPGYATDVEVEAVAPVDVIVDEGGEEIVRRSNRVKVTGEVEVYLLHRYDLRIAAAGGAPLHSQARPERWLAQAHDRPPADSVQGVAETNRGGALALAGRRRRHGRDQDQLAVGMVRSAGDVVERDLGLPGAVLVDVPRRDAEIERDVLDRQQFCGPREFDIARHAHPPLMASVPATSIMHVRLEVGYVCSCGRLAARWSSICLTSL